MVIGLTRSEFDNAVRDALRHYARPDLLATNPLLGVMAGKQPGSAIRTTQELRAMLGETAGSLFGNARDQNIYRVLDLTYFNPAPKQEAAAERLGLSFSTYRRYLGFGIGRLAEFLWRQQQDAPAEPLPAMDIRQQPGDADQRRRLSIIVLPFLNLSPDPELGYLADGIVDSLMTDLSRALPGSFIISRSTAFTYKGRNVPVRQIGQELKIRYVLEGSVLADATHVRVNAQLVDARTDEHLWAERFDKQRRDILRVQEEIVARLSRSVGIEMLRSEAGRGHSSVPQDSDAIDLVMRGRALVTDIRQKSNAADAVSVFRRALLLDPVNVDAMVGIAATRIFQLLNRYQTAHRDELLNEAEALIARAFALMPDHIGVLKARAVLLRARGRFEEAIVATGAVIESNPGEPTAYREMGLNQLYLGETSVAVEWFRRADDVAPRDPMRWTWLQGLGRALLQLGRDSEAASVMRLVMDSNPGWVRAKAFLAAAEALTGNVATARAQLAEYLAAEPNMTVDAFLDTGSSVPPSAVSPVYRREVERILDGLRRAGMPGRSFHRVGGPQA